MCSNSFIICFKNQKTFFSPTTFYCYTPQREANYFAEMNAFSFKEYKMKNENATIFVDIWQNHDNNIMQIFLGDSKTQYIIIHIIDNP